MDCSSRASSRVVAVARRHHPPRRVANEPPISLGDIFLCPDYIARRAEAGHLVLVHLYPAADDADPGAVAAATFGGPVTIAEDGMEWGL